MVMNALMLLHTEPSSLGRWSLCGSYMREMVPLLKLNKHLDCPPADTVTKTIMTSQLFKRMTECTQWGTKDDHMLVPKNKGAGTMISDFISE